MSIPPPSFLESTRNKIKQNGWKRLLLAVSGGLDSICLAHFFAIHKADLGIEWLGIAHVHHGLREGTADRDAEFVRYFANKLNISFSIEYLDGLALKNASGSLEENARDARYRALHQFAAENRADAILTAHHAGDQAETVYLRLRRGTTLAGLRGIQQVNKLQNRGGAEPTIELYRPFLNVPHAELLQYAKENHLTWCEDESNADVKFARNQIRHTALPHLEKVFPGASEQLCRLAIKSQKAYDKLIQRAEQEFSPAILPEEEWPFQKAIVPFKKCIALNANVIARRCRIESGMTQSEAGMTQVKAGTELFRLWLDFKGFRFPLEAFNHPNPFFPNSEHNTNFAYRIRFIEKCRNIVWIYEKNATAEPVNLYLANEKQDFSQMDGCWRHPHKDDILHPLDERIKARPLAQWLLEKGIPRWMHPYLTVFAQGSRVLFVSGIHLKAKV